MEGTTNPSHHSSPSPSLNLILTLDKMRQEGHHLYFSPHLWVYQLKGQ